MKVLFYTLYDPSQITFTAQYCDYMVDCLFHGFRSLLGSDCVDYQVMPQWYNTIDKTQLYGNGFTIYGLCPEIEIDRDDLDHKIDNGFFDQIIVGIHNNRYNCSDNINVIKRLIGPKNNLVKVICGNDFNIVDTEIATVAPFFKRELQNCYRNTYPISFCIPKEKVLTYIPNKEKFLSDEKPNWSGKAGWKIKNEQEFYNQYRTSTFAITQKKGGWDCLRHYEILMNGCIPLFEGLENCPDQTLAFLPKLLLLYIRENIKNFSADTLEHYIGYLLNHTIKYLTTESMAKYVLEIK